VLDFTIGRYIDVYDGNLNTLKNMQAKYPNKYHMMMTDIYTQVRCVPDSFNNRVNTNHPFVSATMAGTAALVANIAIEELDG